MRGSYSAKTGRLKCGKSVPARLSAVFSLLLVVAFLASCRPAPQYQEHFTIPGTRWDAAFQPVFRFHIEDTAARYQLFLTIRHSDAYPFSNIWVNIDTRAPGDTAFGKMRFEVPLAAPSGQWLGRGFGELWEQRVPVTSLMRPAAFPKKGDYIIRLTHDMRRNPLPEIYNIGLRLEQLPGRSS